MKKVNLVFATTTKPFSSWSDKKLAADTLKIQVAMTGNADFPTPVPSMADYSAAVADFTQKLATASSTRDVNAVAAKNTSRQVLIDMSISLGIYASFTANGNEEMLISTSLPLRKQAVPVVLGKPGNFRCINGLNPGELQLKIDTMDGVRSFNFMYTLYPIQEGAAWTTVTSTKSTCVITGLAEGKRYAFRVAAIGSNGQVAWGETLQSPYVQ